MSEKAEKLFCGITNVGDDLIEEAGKVQKRKKTASWRWAKGLAACFSAAILIAAFSFGTAFAAIPDFRQAVISFLFPIYTENRLHEIDEGHRTGSFSMEDTLFTFLEKFNAEQMGAGITVKKENGFEYTVLSQDENLVHVIVSCITPDHKLLVNMERAEYEETTGLWQVISYQILDSETADEMPGSIQ